LDPVFQPSPGFARPIPDALWSAEGTTPDAIEAALRELVTRRHSENGGLVPARALNMIAFVDSSQAGEIAERLAGVGRYHASRLVVLSYDPGRLRLDARAVVSTDSEPAAGEIGLLRETVTVEIGPRHMDDLVTIVDPLMVTDLATLLWSPHGHPEALDELLGLAQAVLIDSVEEPSWRDAVSRACELRAKAYVVDLAWLRSIPWRERLAAAFDSPSMRARLRSIESVSVRYHPDSTIAALLLVGWLGSRLGWRPSRLRAAGYGLAGHALCGEREIAIHLEPAPEQEVRGLESVAIATVGKQRVGLRRGPGGLRSRRRDRDGREREWTVLGASRGEAGILGEGIRQSLLRDPTYGPALEGAETMTP
jgi:glucose-6-phosphate dehydrogenase assembly protein OpcA